MSPATRIGLALAASVLLACGPSGEEETGRGEPAAVELAPDFTLPTLDGGSVQLSALRGKTVLIDFWATWCPPCEFQIPILNELYADWRGRDVEVLGVSVDSEGPEVVRAYIEKHSAEYPILLGSESLARDFGAPGFPSLIVIAPDGSIDQVHVGLVELPDLEQAIAEAEGRAPPAGGDGSA